MEKGYVLFNASHHARRPRGPRAAFRILGGFSDAASSRSHARSLPTDCDILLSEIGRAFALTTALPGEKEGAHLQKLLACHNRRLRDHEQEFLGNVTEHKAGGVSSEGGKKVDGDAPEKSMEEECEEPIKISRSCEVRYQNFAVLSVIHDSDEPCAEKQEPAVVVWGLYDTEESAKEAIKKKLSVSIKDLHLEVCSMYEWLEPTEVSKHLDDIVEEFRDDTLTNIISQRKNERRSVKAFRDLCGESEAPMVDLSQPEATRTGFDKPSHLVGLSEGSSLLADDGKGQSLPDSSVLPVADQLALSSATSPDLLSSGAQ